MVILLNDLRLLSKINMKNINNNKSIQSLWNQLNIFPPAPIFLLFPHSKHISPDILSNLWSPFSLIVSLIFLPNIIKTFLPSFFLIQNCSKYLSHFSNSWPFSLIFATCIYVYAYIFVHMANILYACFYNWHWITYQHLNVVSPSTVWFLPYLYV